MKFRLIGALCAVFFIFGLSSVANAALISVLSGQAVSDADIGVMWLADPNAGAGSAFDNGVNTTDGKMTWGNANAWAASLTVGGFTDWRLPTTAEIDATCTDDAGGISPSTDAIGFNCTGSAMGHLYYDELSGVPPTWVGFSGDPDLALFSTIQPASYWSATELSTDSSVAWGFNFGLGNQGTASKTNVFHAWAVRSDGVPPIPVPPAIWLFGSGLLGIIGIAKRRRVS